MNVAPAASQGVDVWLNNPDGPRTTPAAPRARRRLLNGAPEQMLSTLEAGARATDRDGQRLRPSRVGQTHFASRRPSRTSGPEA